MKVKMNCSFADIGCKLIICFLICLFSCSDKAQGDLISPNMKAYLLQQHSIELEKQQDDLLLVNARGCSSCLNVTAEQINSSHIKTIIVIGTKKELESALGGPIQSAKFVSYDTEATAFEYLIDVSKPMIFQYSGSEYKILRLQ